MNFGTPFGKSLAGGGAAFPADAPGYLFNDGLGGLSWDAAATPEAAGADKQIQFNDVGTMGANENLIFDKSTNTLSISGNSYNIYSAGANSKNYFQGNVEIDGDLDVSTGFISISGSDNQVLFNDSGVIGGSNNFTYDNILGRLALSWSGVTGFMDYPKVFVINATRTGGGGEGDPEEGDGWDGITALEINTNALCSDTNQTGLKINSTMTDLPLSVTGDNNNKITAASFSGEMTNCEGGGISGLDVYCSTVNSSGSLAMAGLFADVVAVRNESRVFLRGLGATIIAEDSDSYVNVLRGDIMSYALTKNIDSTEFSGNSFSYDIAAVDSYTHEVDILGFRVGGFLHTPPQETENGGIITIPHFVGFSAGLGEVWPEGGGSISVTDMAIFQAAPDDTLLYGMDGTIAIGSYYGLRLYAPMAIAEPGSTVSITNVYGIYVEDHYTFHESVTVGPNRYNIYSAGVNTTNVFEGTIRSYRSANDVTANLLEFRKTRGSSAGQDGDDIGTISFKSNDDNATPQLTEYAKILAEIGDASDTTEDGALSFHAYQAGTSRKFMEIGYTQTKSGIAVRSDNWYRGFM